MEAGPHISVVPPTISIPAQWLCAKLRIRQQGPIVLKTQGRILDILSKKT